MTEPQYNVDKPHESPQGVYVLRCFDIFNDLVYLFRVTHFFFFFSLSQAFIGISSKRRNLMLFHFGVQNAQRISSVRDLRTWSMSMREIRTHVKQSVAFSLSLSLSLCRSVYNIYIIPQLYNRISKKAIFYRIHANLWYQCLCGMKHINRHMNISGVSATVSVHVCHCYCACIRLTISKIFVKVILHLQCDLILSISVLDVPSLSHRLIIQKLFCH